MNLVKANKDDVDMTRELIDSLNDREKQLAYFDHSKKDFQVIDYFREKRFDYPLFLTLMMDVFLNQQYIQ